MKRIAALLLLTFTCSHVWAISYPTRKQVATKLYANYAVPEYEDTLVEYQKKREGWFVVKSIYDTIAEIEKPVATQLFWSSITGKYVALTIFPKGVTAGFSQRVLHDEYSPGFYDFERCPYYGYDGWYADVILDFGNSIPTNDTTLEGLARAYNAMASAYIGTIFTYGLKTQLMLPEKERLDNYILNAKKDIAMYDVLRKRNPHFGVLIGEVSTKYANEIMADYEAMLYYGRESAFDEYFKEDLYDPFMRGVARGMLENCEQNGILFTNGDNDTYPLWYMQWIKGVRPDVSVMNLSLMNVDKYLHRYQTSFKGALPVQFTLSDATYNSTDLFIFTNESPGWFTPKDFFGTVYQNTLLKANDTFTCVKASQINVQKPKTMYDKFELLGNAPASISIKIDKSYLYQGDMAMLDILLSNFESRPVYFSVVSTLPGWITPFLFEEGLVQRFIPAHRPDNQYEEYFAIGSSINSGKEMMEFLSLDTTCVDRTNGARWITTCKLVASATANVMITVGDTAGGVALLNKIYSAFPLKTWKPQPHDYYLMDGYYRALDFKRGDEIGFAMLDQARSLFAHWNGMIRLSEDDRSDQNRWLQTLDIMVQNARKHGRIQLAQEADKLLQENK